MFTTSVACAALTADNVTGNNLFGKALAISGDRIIVGDYHTETATVFVRSGLEWVQESILTSDDWETGDHFGASVDINGDYAIVGAYGKNNYAGAAYVFKRQDKLWQQIAKLTGNTGESNYFGISVGLSGKIRHRGFVHRRDV